MKTSKTLELESFIYYAEFLTKMLPARWLALIIHCKRLEEKNSLPGFD
jgi:hypothetical protein